MKFTAIVALAGAAQAALSFGKCPTVEYVDKFDATKYAGQWYNVYKDRWMPYTLTADCITQNFTPREDGNVDLYFRGYYWALADYMGVNGTMFQCGEGSKDTWTCQASMGTTDVHAKRHPIHVLATDYENWNVGYECKEHHSGFYKTEWVTINARTPQISDEAMNAALAAIKKQSPSYDTSNWTLTLVKQGETCDYDWNLKN